MFEKKYEYKPIELPEPESYHGYTLKAIEKGLGLPPRKDSFMSYIDYGAKCMLIGYKAGKKEAKRKYKGKIKLLKRKLEDNSNENSETI